MIAMACVAVVLAARNELARLQQREVQREIEHLAIALANLRSKYGEPPQSRCPMTNGAGREHSTDDGTDR
jgi:hypothetical protein